eukprot:m.223156 g.223156  ORF g.223156 m.223156 type:complete len:913 (+) comp17263_c2_seq9:125-2863(+)
MGVLHLAVVMAIMVNVDALRQDSAVVSSLKAPIDLTILPDGNLLIAQINGLINHYSPSSGTVSRWLLVANVDTYGERGLLGAELHPNYPQQPYIYVFYCHSVAKAIRVSRFKLQDNDSELVLWQDSEAVKGPYHYGGGLTFDQQLNLYFSTGDKSFPTANTNGQRLYKLSASNVAKGQTLQTATVLAKGLRNPWKLRYLPASNSLLIFDVGGNQLSISHEEVQLYDLDSESTSTDYGFPSCEGPCNNVEFGSGCNCQQHTSPWLSYRHSGLNSAVVGGFFTDASWSSPLKNGFVWADYARSKLFYTALSNGQPKGSPVDVGNTQGQAIDLQPDGGSGMYYLTLGGQLRHVTYDNALTVNSATVSPLSGQEPLAIIGRYTHVPSVLPPGWSLSWLVDGAVVATNQDLSTTISQIGQHIVTLQTKEGNNQPTNVETWTVTVGKPLDVTIQSNVASFKAGDLLQFSATVQGVSASALSYSWQLLLWHDNHHHLLASNFQGSLATHVVPTAGHSFEGDTGVIAQLTVTHTDGRTGTAETRINPRKVDLNFQTSPTLPVTLQVDGESRPLPFTLDSAVGFKHQLSVPGSLCWQDKVYTFDHWTTGNTIQVSTPVTTLTVPDNSKSWLASYTVTDTCSRSPLSLSGFDTQLLVAFDANSISATTFSSWSSYLGSQPTTLGSSNAGIPVASLSPSWSFARFEGTSSLSAAITGWKLTSTPAYTVALAVRYRSEGWGGVSFGKPACVQALGVGVSGLADGQGGNLMAEAFCSNDVTQSKIAAVGAGWLLHTVTFADKRMKLYVNESIVSTETVPLNLELQDLVVASDPSLSNQVAMDVRWFGIWNRALTTNQVAQLHSAVFALTTDSAELNPNEDEKQGNADSSGDSTGSIFVLASAATRHVDWLLLVVLLVCLCEAILK